MRLRYLIVCDKDGQKTEPELQYYDEDDMNWHTVETIEKKDYEISSKNIGE